MARSPKEQRIRFQALTKYKWEFMRRDPSYSVDYAMKSKFPSNHWRKTYGIMIPFNPSIPFDELRENTLGGKRMLVSAIQPNPAVIFYDCDDQFIFPPDYIDSLRKAEALIEDKSLVPKTLYVRINLLRNTEDIVSDIRDILDEWKKIAEIQDTRDRFKLFGDYIKVYDLRVKKGLTFSKIAKQLDPKNQDPEAAIQKMKRHFKSAEAMIAKKGYRDLS